MPEVIVGPMLRHVGETDATIWVETDAPCEVEVLGHRSPTFTVEDHHFAIVAIEGLEPSKIHPYEVHLDGARAWPPADYEFPQPNIRLVPRDGTLRMLFGSCRCSAPHRPPYTFRQWWHRKGQGIDALRTYAMRMLRQPAALWPHAVVMLGDQLYADQPPDRVKEEVGPRRVHADGPVGVLEDFEEYTVGYRDAWTYPIVRWMLSTLPSSMIFDDHEINDKWKTSIAWLEEKRQTDWYEGRVIGGLMAYWVYQHLGNLSPRELAEEETLAELCDAGDDGGPILRELITRADEQSSHSRFSFCRDLGPARLLVVDSRAGRELDEGARRIMDEDEWGWIESKVDGEHRHLLLGSSLPFLLPHGMHGIEAWCEAVTDGAWGERFKGFGEKARIAANLDHWACFGKSFRELEDLLADIATGRCGAPPDSIVMLAGDVHHCFVTEAELSPDAGEQHSKIWQVVCSGFRKELAASERLLLQSGHTRVARVIGQALARAAKVAPPRLRWEVTTRPHFRNQDGTLEIAEGEVGVRLEQVTGGWRKPRLRTVVEEKLR